MNQEREAQLRQLRELLSLIGRGEGCAVSLSREVVSLGHALGLDNEPAYHCFVGFDSETDAYPVGAIRELWSDEGLKKADQERVEVEVRWKETIVRAALDLSNSIPVE